jgi:hypothetical protein
LSKTDASNTCCFFFTADSSGLGEENGDAGEDVINECPCSTGIRKIFKSERHKFVNS